MIPIIYVYRLPEDWPTKNDPDQPQRPVIRVTSVKLKTLQDNEELDPNTIDEEVTNPGELYLEIELDYGCTHTKFGTAAPWGKWYCGEMPCSHYLGKKGVRNP